MRTTFVNARLIDGTGSEPRTSTQVSVEDGLIAAIGEVPRRDDQVIDLAGRTLMPGLINAHTHVGIVAMLEEDRMPPAVIAAWIYEHCRRLIDLGFTTARDAGGVDGGVVAAIEQGLVVGPRLYVCGPLIIQTGGHGEFRPAYVQNPCAHHQGVPGLAVLSSPVDGAEQVRHAARLAFKRGATFLKVCASGGVTSLSDNIEDTQLTVDELRAAVEEAAARHTYVTAHVHNRQGILNGLEAGVACFEHATALDPDLAERVAAAGAAVVPTLTVAHIYRDLGAQLPQAVIDRVSGVEAGMAAAIRIGHDAGVLVGAGADLIGYDQKQYGMELALVAAVVGPLQAIRTMTYDNARVLRVHDRLGSIEVGKIADLVAPRQDPLADPWAMADPNNIDVVMKQGRLMKDIRQALPDAHAGAGVAIGDGRADRALAGAYVPSRG